jgi:hypothetical protein
MIVSKYQFDSHVDYQNNIKVIKLITRIGKLKAQLIIYFGDEQHWGIL